MKKSNTFHFMAEKFTVMHRNKRVTEETAKEIEKGDYAV